MREFKLSRDIVVVIACAFVVAHIWLLHFGKDERKENARRIMDQYLQERAQ